MHNFSVSTNCLHNIKGLAHKLYNTLAGQTISYIDLTKSA